MHGLNGTRSGLLGRGVGFLGPFEYEWAEGNPCILTATAAHVQMNYTTIFNPSKLLYIHEGKGGFNGAFGSPKGASTGMQTLVAVVVLDRGCLVFLLRPSLTFKQCREGGLHVQRSVAVVGFCISSPREDLQETTKKKEKRREKGRVFKAKRRVGSGGFRRSSAPSNSSRTR